jgi:hypothetical protein
MGVVNNFMLHHRLSADPVYMPLAKQKNTYRDAGSSCGCPSAAIGLLVKDGPNMRYMNDRTLAHILQQMTKPPNQICQNFMGPFTLFLGARHPVSSKQPY